MQPDDTASELAKQKVRDWYDGNVAQRLRDDKGVIVLVMHRLAPDDLTGTFLERGGWRHLSFPLICEDESAEWVDAKGRLLMRRVRGDILNPTRMTPEAVEEIRGRTPPHIFESQYQQNPRFGASGICSVDRFVRYAEPPPFELIIHSWDLAGTKNGGDWTVCAKFGLAKNQAGRDILYLFQVIRLRVELPDVRQLILREDAADKPALICLDANALGLYIFQDLWREGYKQVTRFNTLTQGKSSDLKLKRFYETFPLLYDGILQIPDRMTGQEILLREFAEFPEGKHDDQVDAVSAIAAYREGAIRLARQNAEKFNRYLPREAARRREAQTPPPPPRRTTWNERNDD